MIHERPCMCDPCTAEFIVAHPCDHLYDFAVTLDGAIVAAYIECGGNPTIEVISHCSRTNSNTRMWRSYADRDQAYEVFMQHADRRR